MISRTSTGFRRQFRALPAPIQSQARQAFRRFVDDPQHPGLEFKKLSGHEDLWSARITRDYRAMDRWREDVILWFFIGSHADYEAAMR